jgi:hypothetical protein
MNILFYFNWHLKKPHFGIVLDQLDEILATYQEAEISFIYCSKGMIPCYANPEGLEKICDLCRFTSKSAFKKYRERVNFIEISEQPLYREFNFSSLNDLKQIQYKSLNIGYAALSSFISYTMNLEPLLGKEVIEYLNKLLNEQVNLIDVLDSNFPDPGILDEVYIFNGRTADTRPVFEWAMKNKLETNCLELIKSPDGKYYKELFQNALPHDIKYRHSRGIQLWKSASKEYRETKGSEFFEKRRKGELARDIRVYTGNQKLGKLPDSWDFNKRNIVIFISSENEFVAIGDLWEDLAVYKSQENGIITILSDPRTKSLNFYIRVHPNLAKVDYGYHKRLYNLSDSFKNVHVISAESEVSSYTLIDQAEKIISFGSSVGIEATYWGKPSIQLAGSFYYYLDGTHKPSTHEELINQIINNNLQPKQKMEAVKYGFMMMSFEDYTAKAKYQPNTISFLGQPIATTFDFLKVLSSAKLFKLTEWAMAQGIKNKRGINNDELFMESV